MPSSRKNSLRSVDEEEEEEEVLGLGSESIMMQLFEDVEAACDPFRSQHNSPTGSLRLPNHSAPRLSLPSSFDSPITPTQASFSAGLYNSLTSNDEPPRRQQRTTRGSSLPELSQHHPHHHLEPIQPLKLVKLRKQGTRPVIPKRTSSFGWEHTDLNSPQLNKTARRFPLPPTHLPPKELPPTPTQKSFNSLSPSPSLTSSFSSASSSNSSPTFLLTPPSTPGSFFSSANVKNDADGGTTSKMDALENFLRGMDFNEGEGEDGVDQMAERKTRREEAQKWGRWEGRELKEWRGRVGGGRRF